MADGKDAGAAKAMLKASALAEKAKLLLKASREALDGWWGHAGRELASLEEGAGSVAARLADEGRRLSGGEA